MKLDEFLVLGSIWCAEYIVYAKATHKDMLFLYKNEPITVKTADKIFESFKYSKTTKNLKNFIKEFMKFALEDKEFLSYIEEREKTCEHCGYCPIQKDKISMYHPEWPKVQEEDKNYFGKKGFEYSYVELWKCPSCKYEFLVRCGIDEHPEIGLK